MTENKKGECGGIPLIGEKGDDKPNRRMGRGNRPKNPVDRILYNMLE